MPQLSILQVVGGKIRTDLACTACELCQSPELTTNRMSGAGAKNPRIMVVGVAPGRDDDRFGKPATGSYGRLLAELLREAGIDLGSVYVTNALKCCLYNKKAKDTQWKACQDYLRQEILEHKPTIIISTGAQAMTWLTGHSGLRKLRRCGLPCVLDENILVYPVQQPAALFHADDEEYERLREEMVADLRWVRDQLRSGNTVRQHDISTDYKICRTPEDVDELFEELEQHDLFSCDLETGDVNFKPRLFPEPDCRIISVGFSWGAGIGRALPLYARGVSSIFWWPTDYLENVLYPRLRDFFRRKRVFGHNFANFDQKWIRYVLGVDFCKLETDTMLEHYILDEEQGTHGLERLAMVFTSMEAWKDTFTLDDTERMCRYLCKDVDAGWRLHEVFKDKFTESQKWLLNELLLPSANLLMDVEFKGVRVSRENLERLDKYLASRIVEEIRAIQQSREVRAFELARNCQYNPDSFPQTADLFENFLKLRCIKRTSGGAYSVDKEVLEAYEDVPVVGHILAVRRLRKLHSTYCVGMKSEIKSDGRIHTSYKLHGTVTGRPASANPNLNNLPREDTVGKILEDGSQIKGVFAADIGHVLIEADYSQIELRVLASLSKDPSLCEIYQKGLDAHAATAAKVYGIPIEQVTSAQRVGAKGVNFGVVYGMHEESLIAKFVAAGNTERQAREFYRLHQETFPGVWRYMREQELIVRTFNYQETPHGRRRRYVEIDSHAIRQAYNFPIQSWASDFVLVAMIRASKMFPLMGLRARPVLTVYDSLVYSVPAEQFWQTAKALKSIMEGISHPLLLVPIKVDMKVGPTWGDLRKIDFSGCSLSA